MAILPAVVPDGAKLRQLMWDQGYSVQGFARKLQRVQQSDEEWADFKALEASTLYQVRSANQRVSISALKLIAAVLEVEDWRDLVLPEAMQKPAA